MLRVLLVDDSSGSLRTMRNLLKRYCPQVEILGEADSLEKAYEMILSHRPNLLLLDIEMPQGTGFDLLQRAKDQVFEVIFITAHENYALDAIRHKALDYILKPIGHISLMEAIKRAESRLQERTHAATSPEKSEDETYLAHKLAVPTTNGFEFISFEEILYLEASGIYSLVIKKDKKSITTTLRMGELETKLEEKGFFRIHRSYMINLAFIKQYFRGNGGYVVLDGDIQLPVSRNRKEAFLKRLG